MGSTAWLITGSTAVLGDALESVVHVLATGVMFWCFNVAEAPPDENHPYGHGQAEHLSVGLGGLQAMDALRHLGNGAGVLPFSMMIGPDGQVQRSHVGELDDEAIQRWLLGSYTPAASDPA